MKTALFIHGSHRLRPDVTRLAERTGQVFVIDCDAGGTEKDAANFDANLILNFLTREVFRGFVLDRPNVNFHPACPAYPGIGATSRALFDGVKVFGATAHRMVRQIDAGPILAVERVPVVETDSSETLFARVEDACMTLVDVITRHIARTGELPPPCGEQWTGRYIGNAEFFRWLEIDLTKPDDLERKIRAARHSTKHGPYIMVNGYKFVLAK